MNPGYRSARPGEAAGALLRDGYVLIREPLGGRLLSELMAAAEKGCRREASRGGSGLPPAHRRGSDH